MGWDQLNNGDLLLAAETRPSTSCSQPTRESATSKTGKQEDRHRRLDRRIEMVPRAAQFEAHSRRSE
jgi:hypothetical protein